MNYNTMWCYIPCPTCGRPVSVWETQPGEEDIVIPQLEAAVKAHYTTMHGIEKLLLTDDELYYQIKNTIKTSSSEPTW